MRWSGRIWLTERLLFLTGFSCLVKVELTQIVALDIKEPVGFIDVIPFGVGPAG
jgi:hypothetical protein